MTHETLGWILVIAIPVLLVLFSFIGDLVPGILSLTALGAAILIQKDVLMQKHVNIGVTILLPLGVAVAYKIIRRDKKGKKGNFGKREEE